MGAWIFIVEDWDIRGGIWRKRNLDLKKIVEETIIKIDEF